MEAPIVKTDAEWKKILAFPAAQRRYRSVWAAFMIGKAYLFTDPAQV